jgi:hypothetical protein
VFRYSSQQRFCVGMLAIEHQNDRQLDLSGQNIGLFRQGFVEQSDGLGVLLVLARLASGDDQRPGFRVLPLVEPLVFTHCCHGVPQSGKDGGQLCLRQRGRWPGIRRRLQRNHGFTRVGGPFSGLGSPDSVQLRAYHKIRDEVLRRLLKQVAKYAQRLGIRLRRAARNQQGEQLDLFRRGRLGQCIADQLKQTPHVCIRPGQPQRSPPAKRVQCVLGLLQRFDDRRLPGGGGTQFPQLQAAQHRLTEHGRTTLQGLRQFRRIALVHRVTELAEGLLACRRSVCVAELPDVAGGRWQHRVLRGIQ